MRPCAGAGSRPQLRPSQPARANDFVVVRLFEPCGPQPPAAEARKRAPQAAPDIPYEVTALTFAVKPLFAPSAAFHSAIATQRLLRATATVRRESWRRSVRSANVGLRPRMLPMPLMPATWLSRRARHVPWTPMELVRTDSPCAASKHLHVKLLFFYYI